MATSADSGAAGCTEAVVSTYSPPHSALKPLRSGGNAPVPESGMANRTWHLGLLAIAASALVAGCLPEAVETPVPAPAEEPQNVAPTISGTPATAATAGTTWQFQPAANDANGDALAFSAVGLPAWASIDTQT